MILEPDVALTDFALAVECGWFALWIARNSSRSGPLSRAFLLFFVSVGVAALLGGITHGFLPDPNARLHRLAWTGTMLAIGTAALASWAIGAQLVCSPASARRVTWLATCVFAGYAATLLLFDHSFGVAILHYLPAAAFLLFAFSLAYGKQRIRALRSGIAGVALTFLAAAVQQTGTGLHPLYFNHNALYHLIQAVGLLMIFVAARGLLGQPPPPGAQAC